MTADHIASRTTTRTEATAVPPRSLAGLLVRIGLAAASRLRVALSSFAAAGQLGPAADVGLSRHTGGRI